MGISNFHGNSIRVINGDSVALVAGTPVCYKSDGTVWAARADSQARTIVLGLLQRDVAVTLPCTVITHGPIDFEGFIDGAEFTPLTPGRRQYLGVTGRITEVPPSAPGQSVVELGFSLTSECLHVSIQSPILL